MCKEIYILSLDSRFEQEKKYPKNPFNREKMEHTSGTATEEGPFPRTDRHAIVAIKITEYTNQNSKISRIWT